jgi:hypothetical protein
MKGLAEKIIPFTNVERSFVGDRYGEKVNKQMEGLDYFCQTKLDTIITPEPSNTLERFNVIFWRNIWRFHLFQFIWRSRIVFLILLVMFLMLIRI